MAKSRAGHGDDEARDDFASSAVTAAAGPASSRSHAMPRGIPSRIMLSLWPPEGTTTRVTDLPSVFKRSAHASVSATGTVPSSRA